MVERHGSREAVKLQEVELDQRAPILRCYLHRAEGVRAHFRIDHGAPVEALRDVAAQYPVFRVTAADPTILQ